MSGQPQSPRKPALPLEQSLRLCVLVGPYVSYQRAAEDLEAAYIAAGAQLVPEPRLAEVVIIHDDLVRVPHYFARYPSLASRYTIGYCVWETEQLPSDRRRALAMLDAAWTPSFFSHKVLAALHNNVSRIAHRVAAPEPSAKVVRRMRRRVNYDPSCFYFYAITRADDPRKNLAALVRAFVAVHQQHPDTRLIVKQYGSALGDLHNEPGVVSITAQLSNEEIAALHVIGNAYVSPHRAEGWGLSLAAAMAYGNVLIATDYSGSRDFLDTSNGYPVPYRLVPIPESVVARFPKWSTDMHWAEVDHDALVQTMAQAWRRRFDDECRWRATAITARYGLAATTEAILKELSDVAAHLRKPRPQRDNHIRTGGRPSVGMLHYPDKDEHLILGRQRASEELVMAFNQHGRLFDYGLFVPGTMLEKVNAQLAPQLPQVTVHARRYLDTYLQQRPVNVWHDLQLDTIAPFEIRNRTKQLFPITIVHHTISYRHLFHQRWLPLLLAQPRSYDALICTSTAARDALRIMLDVCAARFNERYGSQLSYGGRLVVLPLGVDIERFRPRDPRQGRARFELDPDAFVLLWVGRLSAVDKADLLPLVQVFAELCSRHQRRLLLVCCGTERPAEHTKVELLNYAEQLGVRQDVKVLTGVRDGIEELFSCADVFVSPIDNLQESFGMAAVEAMASGVPQVVSDWDGYRDTVVDNETGYLIPTYWTAADDDLIERPATWQLDHITLGQSVAVDLPSMLDALDRLVRDEELRRRLAHGSRKRAVQKYAWSRIVRAQERLWIELGEAAATSSETNAIFDYAQPLYAEAFAGYPTRMLDDATQLIMTAHGRRVAGSEVMAPTHFNKTWGYLDTAILRQLIQHFALHNTGSTMKTAIDEVSATARRSVPDALIRRQLMWLLKYNILALGSETPSAS